MGYPQKLLAPGEEVAVDVRPHWRFLFAPVAVVVTVLAGSVAALVGNVPHWAELVIGAVLVLCLGWLAVRWARWATTSFVVTTSRLIMRRGVLHRSGREILLDRLTDITYNQTLFDRLTGCGDLLLESAGRDSPEAFADLPHPTAIQAQIYRLITERRGGLGAAGVYLGGAGYGPGGGAPEGGAAPGGAPGGGGAAGGQRAGGSVPGGGPVGWAPVGGQAEAPTLADQLAQLDELRRRRVISRREFAAKKAELLSRL